MRALQLSRKSGLVVWAVVVATCFLPLVVGVNANATSPSQKYKVCIQKANRQKKPSARLAAKQACEAISSTPNNPTSSSPVASTAVVPPNGPVAPAGIPQLGGCAMFPADNAWNQRVDSLPLNTASATWVNNIGLTKTLHPDFGGPYGIPFVVVPATQPRLQISFTAYGGESDPGPYPVPLNAPVEGAPATDGDRHVLVVQSGTCKLYEMYRAFATATGWNADAGAVFDLNSNALRPDGWTSADAAGLPITPGLARYEDIADGALRHALRFTVRCTQRAYIHPATHQAGQNNPACPPMGARFRMKSSFDISKFTGQTKILLAGLQTFGMIVADNGSDWFITGSVDPRWDVADLEQLKSVPGSAFEAVDSGSLIR